MLDEAAPRPVLLLGAGASVKSGVPAAAGFAEMIARWAFLRELGRSEWDQSIHRSDWLPWLKRFPWYDTGRPPEHQYPALVENLLTPREARMQFFVERVRAAPRPSEGYVALAELIAKGWIRTVLTTNFDDLIEQACRANPSALLTTVRSPTEAEAVSMTPRYAQLVFLHGTVEHYTDLNLASETETLASALVDSLVPLLRDSPLVVIGYRGAELSIMRGLLLSQRDVCNKFRHGIYWCVRPGAVLAPLVNELSSSLKGNFLRVEITGFDDAMLELARDVGHSVRARPAEPDETLPSNELVPDGELSDLDWTLVREKIPMCAARLDLEAPSRDDALVDLLVSLNLAVREGAHIRATVAGLRLLGVSTELRVHLSWDGGDRVFTGNILGLLDQVRDALAELNEPYRLKGPRSVDVRAFEPLALKELLVNALVHRDYDVEGDVRVVVSASEVVFTSPGGVISTIDPERLGRAGVKGYRNQVIANVLFGTGDMDKLGSGLIDVRRWAQEAGADARFSVPSNATFVAELLARPERPTIAGQPAQSDGSYEVFFANALPVRIQRGLVDVAPCRLSDRRQLWDRYPGVPTGPFLLRGRTMVTLEDLSAEPAGPLRKSCSGPPESFDFNDYCTDQDHERNIVQLLNESLGRHAGHLGLHVDWGQRRMWFPRDNDDSEDNDGTVEVTYTGRVKQSTRTVVKVRRATSGEVIYFEHSSLSWQFRRLGGSWYLFLLPGWVFTRDGVADHLSGRRVTSLSTRRAARDYNANVSAHIFFWAHVLTGGADEVVLQDGGSSVALVSHPLTTHLAGMPSTPGTGEPFDDGFDDDDDDDVDDDIVEASR